jgi:hypothetical protein
MNLLTPVLMQRSEKSALCTRANTAFDRWQQQSQVLQPILQSAFKKIFTGIFSGGQTVRPGALPPPGKMPEGNIGFA